MEGVSQGAPAQGCAGASVQGRIHSVPEKPPLSTGLCRSGRPREFFVTGVAPRVATDVAPTAIVATDVAPTGPLSRFALRLAGGFGLDRDRSAVHHGGNAHGALYALLADTTLAHRLLVTEHAARTAVDRGNRERVELEVGLVDSRVADHLHAQPGGHARVLLLADQMHE